MGVIARIKAGFVAASPLKTAGALVPVSRGHLISKPLPAPLSGEILEPLDAAVKPALMRFEIWCAKTGKPFLGVAEKHGKTLWLIDNEPVGGEIASSGWQPGYDYYEIDAHPAWRCPWCGVREDRHHDFLRLVWSCSDPACGQPLHCCGSRRGVFRCACGQHTRRKFHRVGVFQVYEYCGLRGPDGRGQVCSYPEPDGGVRFSLHGGASTGSLLRR